MAEDTYTTTELLHVSGLAAGNFKQLVNRDQLVLSGGKRVGSGNARLHTKTDVLQAAFISHLARIGITPRRIRMTWAMCVVPNLAEPELLILFAPRADDSDLDIRLVFPGQDGGMDRDDAPPVFSVLDLGRLKRQVGAKLANLRSAAQ